MPGLGAFDPAVPPLESLLRTDFESHDPTRGNEVGTQYRSGIHTRGPARAATARGFPEATTEIRPLDAVHFAEGYHRQSLAENPDGRCGLVGTGVSCRVGPGVAA